jgi:cytidine deaminase
MGTNIVATARAESMSVDAGAWQKLSEAAWRAREHAFLVGKTAVGAAVLTSSGSVFSGCNVEHRFRCHDIHAEVNAIGTMIAAGKQEVRAILVVANRERFTPCGGCMDWIFQFGGDACLVAFQSRPGDPPTIYSAAELMPHYPK